MSIPSVLVLDSGIGGLSIAREIRDHCPGIHIDYLADLAAFPYGIKSEEEIIARMTTLVDRLVDRLRPTVIVVACNTASTVALNAIRERTHIPVVGVVPAIKPAAQLSETGVIGVLATEGTVNRIYTRQLIEEFASSRTVILHGSSLLVQIAEQKLQDLPIDLANVRSELGPLFEKGPNMDTVVLACTHFPLLRDEFAASFAQVKFWVDSGLAIARRVAHLLSAQDVVPPIHTRESRKPHPNHFFVTSANSCYHPPSLVRLLGEFSSQTLEI